mmetsp:Transcript_17331/g.40671  ORF Transcript_17331/g.40671 Transcript_17331/m.40671 type:complete len:282 (+) Transcript_17331:1574-2419(+)
MRQPPLRSWVGRASMLSLKPRPTKIFVALAAKASAPSVCNWCRTSDSASAHASAAPSSSAAPCAASNRADTSASLPSWAKSSRSACLPRILVNFAACTAMRLVSACARRSSTCNSATEALPPTPATSNSSSARSLASSSFEASTVSTGVRSSPTSSCSTSTVSEAGGYPGMRFSAMQRSSVDLPAPFAPMKPYRSPEINCKCASCKSVRPATLSVTPSTSTPWSALASATSLSKRLSSAWTSTNSLLNGPDSPTLAGASFLLSLRLRFLLAPISASASAAS